MKTKFILPALTLAIICSVLTAAQTQQPPLKSSADATKTPAVNPLALTDAEKSDLINLANAANELDRQLLARLRAVLNVSCAGCDEAYTVSLVVADARKFNTEQAQPASERYNKRLAEIQKAHDCEGCAIKGGEFVKKAEAK